MPTYAYACTDCSHHFEIVQSFTDDSLTDCPRCEGRLRKLFNAVGVVFKGSGFYRTDSRDSRSGNGARGSARSSPGTSSGSSGAAASGTTSTTGGADGPSSSSGSTTTAAASGGSGTGGGSAASSASASGGSSLASRPAS